MSWCGCVCDSVEAAVESGVDAAEDFADSIFDAAEEGIEIAGDFFEDIDEWTKETIEDFAKFVEDVATKIWDWITETASSVWEWIKKVAGDVWEWTTGALEDAWDWVSDAASDAWDWVSSTAETIWDVLVTIAEAVAEFMEERVVPFLLDALWVLTHIDDLIIALFHGLMCLITHQDEKEYDVIEGMFMLDEEAFTDRSVTFLPVADKYVIFSDHHLFVAGDPLDRFRQIGNHELYQAVLAAYYLGGHTLIENGDVEDLWMREMSLGDALLDEVTEVLGWPFGTMIEEDHEDYRIRSQAVKIFDNNSDIYQTIRNLFHDTGRFVRLLGNHDDIWRSSEYLPGLQVVYPGLKVFDYAFIGNYGAEPPRYGNSPDAIVAHGHQIDGWNNSVCRAAGVAITEAASGIPSLAAEVVERSEWEDKLSGLGFDNKLSESMRGIDEVEFYETIEDDFSNHSYVPQFILGHTHKARKNPRIPSWVDRHEGNFNEYTNDGTAGRWEQFIWCVTVENGIVTLRGWTWGSDGKPHVYTFLGGFTDYLQAI